MHPGVDTDGVLSGWGFDASEVAVARHRRGALRNPVMPIPEQRDLDKARGVIRDWLATKLPRHPRPDDLAAHRTRVHRFLERDLAVRRLVERRAARYGPLAS
jgi:hypothetical protein